MHMSNMKLAKDKQGTTKEIWKDCQFPGCCIFKYRDNPQNLVIQYVWWWGRYRDRWKWSGGSTCLRQLHHWCLFFYLKKISATKMNYEKPPAGGGVREWIRISLELARLHFHFRPRNQGKGGEHIAVVSIMQEIHALFIKWYILSNISKSAHNRLP